MHTEILTGKTRYRIHQRLFREDLLVLEVEVHVRGTYYSPLEINGPGLPYDRMYFRDATPFDLADLRELSKVI